VIVAVLQLNRLRGLGHVLQKNGSDWIKKYTDYVVVGGDKVRGRPKRA